jgi:TatD DNase family protein
MELFDCHAHYNDEKFENDREEILKKVYESGVTKLVCAGYDKISSKKAVQIAQKHDFIYAIVGISPNDIPEENLLSEQLKEVEILAKLPKVVAIGEIGLDYHWNKENKEKQKEIFIKQIELANKLELPIVIHTREAIFDTLSILKQEIHPMQKGIFHCCPLNLDLIKEGLKLGFYISFAGPITFKNSKNAEEAIKAVPLEKILIETDSPYLAPEPVRGTRNDSSNVIYMAEKIAQVKQMSTTEVAKATYENAKRIFQIL